MNGKPNMYVYYNSACPVCKAGIEGQMKKASACEIQLVPARFNGMMFIPITHLFLRSVLNSNLFESGCMWSMRMAGYRSVLLRY